MPYVLDDSDLDRPAQYVLRKVRLERGSKLAKKVIRLGTPNAQSGTKYRFGNTQKLRIK